jgi:hypothetical protein
MKSSDSEIAKGGGKVRGEPMGGVENIVSNPDMYERNFLSPYPFCKVPPHSDTKR